jgi:hypothetical protein
MGGVRIAFGPIRLGRIVPMFWIASLWPLGEGWTISSIVVAMIAGAYALRAAFTRVELTDDEIIVVNVLRTRRVPRHAVERAGFASVRWRGAVPLMLVGPETRMPANGVSVWARMVRWPDQPHAPSPLDAHGARNVARLERFFEGTAISFDAREPINRRPVEP